MKTTIPVHDNINPDTPLNPDDLFFLKKILHHLDTNAAPPLHRHPFYEIIFVINGKGKFKIDFEEYELKRGSVYFFTPGQTHVGDTDKDFEMYILRFEPPVFQDEKFMDNIRIFNFDTLYLDESKFVAIEALLGNLCEEFSENKALKEMTINNLLKLLLIKVQRLLPDVINCNVQTNLFNTLNNHMKENEYRVISASEYAKELKVPIHTLNSAIKEYTGMTSAEYIRSKTMVEVKRLLYYTELNTSEIAWQLGFVDPGYFSRFFKREAGMSPTELRKDNHHI